MLRGKLGAFKEGKDGSVRITRRRRKKRGGQKKEEEGLQEKKRDASRRRQEGEGFYKMEVKGKSVVSGEETAGEGHLSTKRDGRGKGQGFTAA